MDHDLHLVHLDLAEKMVVVLLYELLGVLLGLRSIPEDESRRLLDTVVRRQLSDNREQPNSQAEQQNRVQIRCIKREGR